MAAYIDIDAGKIFKKSRTRLKIGKRLKTAGLNSRFTGSKQRRVLPTSTWSFLKNFVLPTNDLKGTLSRVEKFLL